MKKLMFILPLLAMLAVACEESDGCYPPIYKGFSYTPSPVSAGDSVTITAVQAQKGHWLNACTYTWSMTVNVTDSTGATSKETLSYTQSTNYDGTYNGDPTWIFKMPDNTVAGTYSCSFSAKWSNSADAPMASYASQNDGTCSGSITSYSYTLYSTASGSFSLSVKK